jgi:hypothetical protein
MLYYNQEKKRRAQGMKATPSQKKKLNELLMRYPICYQPEGLRDLVFCDPVNKELGRVLGPTGRTFSITFYPKSMDVRHFERY